MIIKLFFLSALVFFLYPPSYMGAVRVAVCVTIAAPERPYGPSRDTEQQKNLMRACILIKVDSGSMGSR